MNKPDIVAALKPVVEALEKLGVPYYVGGSVASSAYGMARSTMDIVLASSLKPEHVRPPTEMLQPTYYIDDRLILDAIRRSSSFNLIHLETMFKIDVFLPRRSPYEIEVFRRRRPDSLPGEEQTVEIYLASPEDVVRKKLAWFRPGGEVSENQWNDIRGELKVQKDSLDIGYLRRWATELGVGELLTKALREAEIGVQ